MNNIAFILRPMLPADIANAMKLVIAEGWNQTEKDWKLVIENPGNNCILAEADNKVIGTTTIMNYAGEVGWIGLVLVDKAYRGMGLSKSMLSAILQSSTDIRSIKLDATPDGQRVYPKFGFIEEYQIARMVNLSIKKVFAAGMEQHLAEPVESQDINEIIALDEIVFGAKRAPLISALINEYPGKAWCTRKNNRLTGFVLGREGNKYHQVGPVCAANARDANMLIATAFNSLTGLPVVVDVPQDKQALMGWLTANGFMMQRQITRMYKDENPQPGIAGSRYLIAGPEYG